MKKSTLKNSGYSHAGASWTKRSMKGFTVNSASPVEDIDDNNYTLRQRSRILYMSDSVATSAIKTNRTNVIGTGLKLKPRVDKDLLNISQEQADKLEANIEREFNLWARDKLSCDATGNNDFYEMQQLAFASSQMSGDVFAVVKHKEPDIMRPYSLRLHVIEADRISTPSTANTTSIYTATTGRALNGNMIYDGVEVDNNGEAVAYYVCNAYPFHIPDDGNTVEWVRIPVIGENTGLPNILHVMDSERPDQYRGVPYLAPVIEPLLQLRRYTDAELTAAVVESCFTVFVKTQENPADNPFNEAIGENQSEIPHNDNEYELGAGNINYMYPDEDIEFADPKRPASGFGDFTHAICEQVGAALEIPSDLLLKSFNSSYSASRAALLEAWKAFRMRREWFISDFCQPAYELWFHEAVANGRINAPGFFNDPLVKKAYTRAEWIGPTQGQLDPVKEVNAELASAAAGLTTYEDAAMRLNGSNWDTNMDQLTHETERLNAIKNQGDKDNAKETQNNES